MLKKLFLIGAAVALLLVGCGTPKAPEPISIEEQTYEKSYFDSGMQKFPSYDWGSEDATALASISANTLGSDKKKQEAIIYALDRVWYHDNISLSDWAYGHYELYNNPTDRDYELVNMVIFGEWAE